MTSHSLVIETPFVPILVAQSTAGMARKRWLERKVMELAEPGARAWIVSCDFDIGGPWAGVNTFISAILAEIKQQRPDLLRKHSFELVHVIPPLRRTLTISNPTLTDLAVDDEKVRNYAADRAYRIVHGLIDMLDSWKSSDSAETPWIIGCDAFDLSGSLGGYFFKELMRRRGLQLHIRMVATVSPDKGDDVRSVLSSTFPVALQLLDLPDEPVLDMNGAAALQKAIMLEEQVGDDRAERQVHLPALIKLWGLAGRMDKVIRWRYFGLAFYAKLGMYADARRYGEGLLDLLLQYEPENRTLRWWIMIKLLNAYTGLSAVEPALALVEATEQEKESIPAAWRIHVYYMAAMLYARYSKPRDLAKGEELLNRGLQMIYQAEINEDERHFRAVFNRNGIAMIRSFQGRFQEAIELCRAGLDELNTYLSITKHQLHRSILLYNIAQVYVATNSDVEAIHYLSAAMEMDPNYSEYYNERGSILLRLGRHEEALDDYLKAIELSPPYFEIWTNLGQCYRRLGKMEAAVNAYSKALDLEPGQPLALLGRAKAQEEIGNIDEAVADYTQALALDVGLWDAHASRGVLYYEKGELQRSLNDFNRAIELKPNAIDLYRNRAVVLIDLARHDLAVNNLEAALLLDPSPDDRNEIQALLASAQATVGATQTEIPGQSVCSDV